VVVLWAATSCGGAGRRTGASTTSTFTTGTFTTSTFTTSTTGLGTQAALGLGPALVPPTPPSTAALPKPLVLPGVAVGDSVLEDVLLYAPQTLSAHGITIDAAVGRQWSAGVQILTLLRQEGQLPAVVIVALGSNGRITAALFDQMMQACAGVKRVVFMTVTGALIGNNPIITAGVARFAPRAVLADWHALASAHPEWFGPDHVHVGPAGARALGTLLARLS
jgi:hypothetical protein